MTLGILSVGLALTGYEVLSRIVLVLAGLGWLGLAGDFVVRLLRDRRRWLVESEQPAALTAVAATTVVGSRLSTLGRQELAGALLAVAAALWPVLLFLVVRRWRRGMPGAVFLGCVATQGLAVLGATLAQGLRTGWLAHTALVFFWLGLVLYAAALYVFDWRQIARGAGDEWVAGGAFAISTLAGTELIIAGRGPLYLWSGDDQDVLRSATIALLVLP